MFAQNAPALPKVRVVATDGTIAVKQREPGTLGANKASAVGIASPNASGNYTLNFTIVTATGAKPVHVSAVVSPADGNGTWTDSVGNAGTFAFLGATPGLPPRPLPASGLGAATITNIEIAANAVTSAAVADGSLSMADVANGPRVATTTPSGLVTVGTSATVIHTLSLTAPSAGTIIVNASGTMRFSGTAAGEEGMRCSISTTTNEDLGQFVFGTDAGSTAPESADPFASTRAYDVSAGPFTVNLVCARYQGTGAQVYKAVLTALFVAQ